MSKFITVFATEGEGTLQCVNTGNIIKILNVPGEGCIIVFIDGSRITISESFNDVTALLNSQELP